MHHSSGLETIGDLKGFHSVTLDAFNKPDVPNAFPIALGATDNTNVPCATQHIL